MTLQVEVGGMYKCSCGGVWLAKAKNDWGSFVCERISKWKDSVWYPTMASYRNGFDLETAEYRKLSFSSSGWLDDVLHFISEIEP